MTKKRILAQKRKQALITLTIIIVSILIGIFTEARNEFVIEGGKVSTSIVALPTFIPEREIEKDNLTQSPKLVNAVMVETEMYREFTAYNAGDPYQCDNTPCISASGDNICTLLAQGQIIFASNEFPLGTKLYVEGIGEGIVLDRMNSRFKTRIDVAMQAHEKPRAIVFGLQVLRIKILK